MSRLRNSEIYFWMLCWISISWNGNLCFDLASIRNEDVLALRSALVENIFNLDNIQKFIAGNMVPKSGEGELDYEDYCPGDRVTDDSSPRVEVPGLGTARGRVLTSFLGREFFAFHSIPYAKPPLNELRYKMTEPWEGAWDIEANGIEGDYDATYFRAKCPQPSMLVPMPGGREDCLYISIYTPNTILEETEKKYPVMFFIHGGSFIFGDSSLYIPTKLMDEDVIVISVQYRLGTLGFLASLTPDNPGNMGLMDQVMALRWIQKYITYFGGDPGSVTVFGQSAGGASTSWLQFTNLTTSEYNEGNQLFHRSILESGSALEVWAQDPDPNDSFILEADELGCWSEESSIQETLDCMREKSFQEVVDACIAVYSNDRKNGGLGFLGVSPVIQTQLVENYPDEVEDDPELVFIRESPLALIEEGSFLRIPMMAGSVRDEGSLVLGLAYDDFLVPNDLDEDEDFLTYEIVPFLVDAFGIEDTTGAVANSFKLTFLKFAEMGNWDSMSGGLVDMTGMLFLKTGLWTMTQLLTNKAPDDPIYFYSFEFDSNDSLFDWFFSPDIPIEAGISHADELLYLFCMPASMDERQITFIPKLTKVWTNFAKCGSPTPKNLSCDSNWVEMTDEWKPFSLDFFEFLLIEDDLRLEYDFTLRWNYNTIPDPDCSNDTSLQYKDEYEARDKNGDENLEKRLQSWKIGALAMGGVCFIFLISIVFILFIKF